MGSRLANEDISSSETSFVECQTLPSRHHRKKCRKNNSFKTPTISKRLKTEHKTTNFLKNGNKSLEDTTGEKKYALRKSNRKKSFDSNIQMEEIASADIQHNLKNDAKEIENETLHQNLSLHLISQKVMKSLDKEFFPEEKEEQHNLNMKCTEECTVEKQFITLTSTNPPDLLVDTTIDKAVQLDANMNHHEIATREIECGSNSQPNRPQLFSEITADNENSEKQTDTRGKNHGDTTNKTLLDTLESHEAHETNNNTKTVVNKVTNDSNLDLLYIDINKADDIINSLAKTVDVENNSSINIHTTDNNSKQTSHLSKIDFVNESFYEVEDKNNFHISVENNSTLNENSSETESSILSKNFQIVVDEKQKKSFGNKPDLKNKQNERKDEILSCNDILLKEGNAEAEFNLSDCKDINQVDMNSIILENQNKITNMLLKYDSSDEFNDQTTCKSETNTCPMEIDNFHNNNDFKNLYSSKILIQNSPVTVNDNEDVADELIKSTENLEVKRKKLTLLYMNALDYEKQNNENANEIMGKDSEITDVSLHSVAGNESIDKITFSTQKNIEISKQDFKKIPKEINEQNTKKNIEISKQDFKKIPKEINEQNTKNTETAITEKDESKNEEKKLNGYSEQNLIGMEKDDDFEMTNTNETYKIEITEKHDSKIESPIKYDSTSYKEVNKICDIQEESTTMQFHNKIITLPSISNNTAIYSNEANIEAIGFKNEEIEKCYKKTCIHEGESTIIVTTVECLQFEQNENSKETESDGRVENTKVLKEDATSHEDIEGIFDMDDDFDLTASQINMIEVDENNVYKESKETKSHVKRENCNKTHFDQDSITVEIIDQLCYIRESIDSMKELLKTFLMKNEDRK